MKTIKNEAEDNETREIKKKISNDDSNVLIFEFGKFKRKIKISKSSQKKN